MGGRGEVEEMSMDGKLRVRGMLCFFFFFRID